MGSGGIEISATKPVASCAAAEAAAGEQGWSRVRGSPLALGARNPIREVTDLLGKGRGGAAAADSKKLLSLAQGDPTAARATLPGPPGERQALAEVAAAGDGSGYGPSAGRSELRQAVADHVGLGLSENDVFVTVGCSAALQLALSALVAAPGQSCNVLVPQPGFPLYTTMLAAMGVEARTYQLQENNGWQVDLVDLDAQIDKDTVAVIVCNPSNPCGVVYRKAHLEEIALVCERAKVPIVADEVYAGMAFDGIECVPLAEASMATPILSVGAVSKKWLLPGWRVGWLCVHDRGGVLRRGRVVEAIERLTQISISTSVPVQLAAAKLIAETPHDFYASTMKVLAKGAELVVRRAQAIPQLEIAAVPQGAMYVFARLVLTRLEPGCQCDMQFAKKLLEEENVAVLPGTAFAAQGFVRFVTCAAPAAVEEAFDRIESFCKRHMVTEEQKGERDYIVENASTLIPAL